jgi:hypothetical protein
LTHDGACLCGAVRFRIEGPLAPIQICHCGECRRAQGSAFAANIPVSSDRFELSSGEDALRAYESSPGKERVFCGVCGSPIFSRLKARPETLRIRAGAIREPIDARVGFHFHTDSKAGWWVLADELPKYPGARPA